MGIVSEKKKKKKGRPPSSEFIIKKNLKNQVLIFGILTNSLNLMRGTTVPMSKTSTSQCFAFTPHHHSWLAKGTSREEDKVLLRTNRTHQAGEMGQFSASKWWQCLLHFAVPVVSLQGAYFAGVGVPANQEYSIQIPAYFSLDIAPLTQIWQCPQITCFTTSQDKDTEQLCP